MSRKKCNSSWSFHFINRRRRSHSPSQWRKTFWRNCPTISCCLLGALTCREKLSGNYNYEISLPTNEKAMSLSVCLMIIPCSRSEQKKGLRKQAAIKIKKGWEVTVNRKSQAWKCKQKQLKGKMNNATSEKPFVSIVRRCHYVRLEERGGRGKKRKSALKTSIHSSSAIVVVVVDTYSFLALISLSTTLMNVLEAFSITKLRSSLTFEGNVSHSLIFIC